MTTRKGGGRDSGAESRPQADSSPSGGRPQAAANPAVESLADFIIPKAAVNPAAHHILDCQLCTGWLNSREQRIRELEAELAETQHALHHHTGCNAAKEAEARVKELERRLGQIADGDFDGDVADFAARFFLQKALHARVSRSSAARKE